MRLLKAVGWTATVLLWAGLAIMDLLDEYRYGMSNKLRRLK